MTAVRLCIPLLAALLAGCHTELAVRSNKLAAYDGNPRRILVVAGNRLYPGAAATQVPSAIARGLERCGIAAEALSAPEPTDALPLDEPEDPSKALRLEIARRQATFRPDAVMIVRRLSDHTRTRTSNYGTTTQLVEVRYNIQILDVASKRAVYRAAMELRPPPFAALSPAQEFARLMVERLADERILTGCPAPTKPPEARIDGGPGSL